MRFATLACLMLLAAPARADEFDKAVGGYFRQHCVRCHGADRQEGEFRIDTLSKDVGRADTALWAEVRERISSGEMPPEDVPQRPRAEDGAAVVEWLSEQIAAGEAARLAERDRVSFHRLSREEYVHTVYDLLGVHFDAADPGGLTEDPEWHGFERIGSVLSLSASHIEKYLEAAERVLAEAYPDKPVAAVELFRPAVPPQSIAEPYRSQLAAEGLLDKVRFDVWPQDVHRSFNPGRLPAAGVYEVRVQLSGLQPPGGRPPRLAFYHKQLDRLLFEQDIVAPEGAPILVTFRTHLPGGPQDMNVTNDVPGPSNLPRSGRHGQQPFVSLARGRIPWQLKLTDEEGTPLYPFLILDWAEWRGPIVTAEEQRLRDEYLPAEDGNLEQVREGLSKLARRAFRRPLRDGEIEPYVQLVRQELEGGATFRAAVKSGMLAILCSKSFLFLVEGDEQAHRNRLNDWELASRLSYFLWSTMPDEELLSLAAQGTLHEHEVLRSQVARLLADPRSRRFCDSFSAQWLRLKKVGMFPPDANLYPQYDAHLERSMVGETQAFFREVLAGDRTLREFLDSDWTMANARLAEFYGLRGVVGDEFRLVRLRPEDHRGGLLTQAAILSLTSDGTRQRPVHRGVWVSEAIFGKSPPPPPANVDPIEPNPVDSPKATLRMKLDAHKAHPHCASCHRKIDPLGLAFENYDAIGSWRVVERVPQGTGSDPPVDASGALPDGRRFADAAEFKRLLLEDLDRFNHTFVEKLATYGLRRATTFEDRPELEALAAQSRAADFRLRAIVEAFVLSDLFQQR